MQLKAWFKSKTADKVLSPIRGIIIDLIKPEASLLDIGCGTGDLLYNASNKIRHGIGIDLDQSMVDYANARKAINKTPNLKFINVDITSTDYFDSETFDVATSTLCLHEMSQQDAINVLKMMARLSSVIIISDYTTPATLWGKVSIELDELISGHYYKFKRYLNNGGIPQLSALAGIEMLSEIKSPIDGINVWVLKGTSRT